MTFPCTGVILAGGLNTRFSGKDKALITVGDKRVIDHIYGVFRELFNEIVLVTNDPVKFVDLDLRIVTDIFNARSSLTGLHAGLFYTSSPYAFVTACDTPFLKKDLVQFIANSIEKKTDVVVPETTEGLEPLCAVYSRTCLKQIEMTLSRQEYQIQCFFKHVRVKKIHETILNEYDPGLLSFFNINTPDDLKRTEEIVGKENSLCKGV